MPIHGLFGRPGHGKTYVAAAIGQRNIARGRAVFSNFHLEGATRFGLEDMADLPPGVILVDEAQNWFHARMWSTMPKDMLERWSQTRKAGWDVFLMSQHEKRVDSIVRDVIQWGWLLEAQWSILTGFRHPLYFTGKRWDMDDFRSTLKGHRRVEVRRWWFRHDIARTYDTYEVIRLRGNEKPDLHVIEGAEATDIDLAAIERQYQNARQPRRRRA